MRGGYTIVEVMIFLAISGMMFVMAAAFVSGKQSTAEFHQGMNEINTKLQQVINDVSNGFYPSNADFTCSSSAGGLALSAGSTGAGANSGDRSAQGIAGGGCVFLGKVVQFGAEHDTSKYNIYTVAGTQYVNGASSGTVPRTFDEAKATAVYKSGAAPIDLTDKRTLQWGVTVSAMYDYASGCTDYASCARTPISAVGFYGSLGSYSGTSLQSGSQTTTVIVMPHSSPAATGDTEAAMVSDISLDTNNADLRPSPNVVICFDGGTGKHGSLIIGGAAGQRLATSINISNSTLTECRTS